MLHITWSDGVVNLLLPSPTLFELHLLSIIGRICRISRWCMKFCICSCLSWFAWARYQCMQVSYPCGDKRYRKHCQLSHEDLTLLKIFFYIQSWTINRQEVSVQTGDVHAWCSKRIKFLLVELTPLCVGSRSLCPGSPETLAISPRCSVTRLNQWVPRFHHNSIKVQKNVDGTTSLSSSFLFLTVSVWIFHTKNSQHSAFSLFVPFQSYSKAVLKQSVWTLNHFWPPSSLAQSSCDVQLQ